VLDQTFGDDADHGLMDLSGAAADERRGAADNCHGEEPRKNKLTKLADA
jgi:hypothetical protein